MDILSGGDPLWHTICALHAQFPPAPLLLICALLPSCLPGLFCLFASLSALYLIYLQRVVGCPPINTYLVGSRFGTPPTPCMHILLAFCASLAVTKVLRYLPSVSDDKTCHLVDALVGRGLYASA